MYEDGYKFIINVDWSVPAINQMKEFSGDKGPTFKYLTMDVLDMEFNSDVFDVVIDKGTLDTVLVSFFALKSPHY